MSPEYLELGEPQVRVYGVPQNFGRYRLSAQAQRADVGNQLGAASTDSATAFSSVHSDSSR